MNSINKYFLAAFIFALSLSVFWGCGDRDNPIYSGQNPFPTVSGPGLYIPDSTFDFGYVPQYGIISHKYRLFSIGDDTLKILDIRPG